MSETDTTESTSEDDVEAEEELEDARLEEFLSRDRQPESTSQLPQQEGIEYLAQIELEGSESHNNSLSAEVIYDDNNQIGGGGMSMSEYGANGPDSLGYDVGDNSQNIGYRH